MKIKLGFFSILAMLTVSVFLTSCEQDGIITQTTENFTFEEDVIYTLPKECNTMSEAELNEYLESLTPTELSNLSSIDNDLESRGACGPWQYVGSSTCSYIYGNSCWHYYEKKSRKKKQVRWCGHPVHGNLQTREVHVGCC